MRVISGMYRGRRLKGPEGMELRPTGDRLKETVFNILGPDISSAVVLDVFGGTGAIGIEALSRGAREVTFIENSPAAHRLILKNLQLCGIETGYHIMEQDVFMALRLLARQGFCAHIAFFDPPYDWRPYNDLLEITFERRLLQPNGRAVIEHYRKASLSDAGKLYRRSRVLRQGDHCLSFYEYGLEVRGQASEDRSQESGVRMEVE
jgi:16S rRNA (guanine966-N2)-methyltransferase